MDNNLNYMAQTRQEIQERYYKKNKVRVLKRGKEWRINNPQRIKNIRLKTRYGISLLDYERMFNEQNGLCKICRKSKKLLVDHNHKNKKVRGLLCHQCNYALGFLDDNVLLLKSALNYIKLYV